MAAMASDANIATVAPSAASRKRKAATQAPTANGALEAPSTPRRRRIVKLDAEDPPTPTPDAVSLIAEEAHTQKPKPAAVTRLADPSRTNALLRSPKTSRIIASTPLDAVSPSKLRTSVKPTAGTTPAAITTTTANILEEACAHLIKVDPRMKPLIDKHYCRMFSPEGLAEQIDPFEALCSSIISQQVSGAAAKSIKARFIALFNPGPGPNAADTGPADDSDGPGTRAAFPRPEEVAATPLDRLRTAGLSQRKAEYIQGLAAKFGTGELTAQMLADAPDDELLARLTAVRGLGRWSAEMFACFALKRMDVFSLGDLGVQRGMAAFVGRDVAKLKAKGAGGKWKYMSEREMVEISDRFRPFRSLFMWYMWRVEETDVSTME
ncbi:3467ab24-c2c5-44f9-97d5-b291925ffaa5 [Thermothielavioides terrestris]|uniref:3467ab24-c2c5-44f9-97d5-b291925ffaa5 n=1 Tax=Thermothielavioides terrestris TaxID=2587410 RepID=A0A3S4C449_9PEZI|nr:3467ab24-c2c5-44f9-97d5-b291925ffaa5 [Thermothielavioides terrestris]